MWPRALLLGAGLQVGCAAPSDARRDEAGTVGGKGDDPDPDAEEACEASCVAFLACVEAGDDPRSCAEPCEPGGTPCETEAQARARHDLIAQRREGRLVMVHRGSWALAKENTLEAYRATIELGADGNEIDVRRTADDELVMFHDDFLDGHLQALGEVSDYTWADLQGLPWRDPGPFGSFTRIPTFIEALDLHRRHGGLVHLDIKDEGIDERVALLLDAMDMWDHVQIANDANAAAILAHPDYEPIGGMVGLTDQRRDLDVAQIDAAIASGAAGLFVDDPRPAIVQLGRTLGPLSADPVVAQMHDAEIFDDPGVEALLQTLTDDADWDAVDDESDERRNRIVQRAWAAIAVAQHGHDDPDLLDALRNRVRQRSIDHDWRFHGLDGKEALAALITVGADDAVDLAEEVVLTAGEPARELLGDDAKWMDWRLESQAFVMLREAPREASQALCRDYLALDDATAEALGVPLFAAAAETLLRSAGDIDTAAELLSHRRSDVRNQARLTLVTLAMQGESFATAALQQHAPQALAWIPPASR